MGHLNKISAQTMRFPPKQMGGQKKGVAVKPRPYARSGALSYAIKNCRLPSAHHPLHESKKKSNKISKTHKKGCVKWLF